MLKHIEEAIANEPKPLNYDNYYNVDFKIKIQEDDSSKSKLSDDETNDDIAEVVIISDSTDKLCYENKCKKLLKKNNAITMRVGTHQHQNMYTTITATKYKCRICKKHFATSNGRSLHRQTHTLNQLYFIVVIALTLFVFVQFVLDVCI